MLNKYLKAVIIIFLFLISFFIFKSDNKNSIITEIYSPVKIKYSDNIFEMKEFDTFDSQYTEKNKFLSNKLKITEDEAFILGNLGKYWTKNLLDNRTVFVGDDDIVFSKRSYKEKFYYSGYCIDNYKPCSDKAFQNVLFSIRKSNYKIIDIESNEIYEIDKDNLKNLSSYVVIKNSHIKWAKLNTDNQLKKSINQQPYDDKNIKLLLTDFTQKLKPERNCSTLICKEILNNIRNSKESIDIAIYGYSEIKDIKSELNKAISRGVQVRLVYDADKKGRNIYPDTRSLLDIIPKNSSDENSIEADKLMHNKFYIFDKKILITGSANLSHTDMSGYNSNSVLVIQSDDVAQIYLKEFEQMYSGKFHNDKKAYEKQKIKLGNSVLNIAFSPQDKCIHNLILPLIKSAKEYIYIPTFVLTDKRVTEALIDAKNRNVDVKIIIDALNASIHHSKHNELRNAGLNVKTENFAGKMHSKAMLIDDKYTLIGSMNFSNSGENKNDENIIIIENSEMTKYYKDFFIYQWQKIDNRWLYKNARAEGKDSIGSCFDGIDNNYDGLTDSEDLACR